MAEEVAVVERSCYETIGQSHRRRFAAGIAMLVAVDWRSAMRLHTTCILFLFPLIFAVGDTCSAQAAPISSVSGRINFDGIPDSTPLRDFYHSLGVDFVRATVVTAGVSLNEFEFSPRSGANVAFDNTGNIVITFQSPVSSVGAHFTYAVPISLQAFDTNGLLVGNS